MHDTPSSPTGCDSRDSGLGLSPRAAAPASPCYGNGGGPNSPPESSCSARMIGSEGQRVYQGVRVRCTVRTLLERQRNGQATGQTQMPGNLSNCMEDNRYLSKKRRASGETPVPAKRSSPSTLTKEESDSFPEMSPQTNYADSQSDDLEEILLHLQEIMEVEQQQQLLSSSPQPQSPAVTDNVSGEQWASPPEPHQQPAACWPNRKLAPMEPKPQEWTYERDEVKVFKRDGKRADAPNVPDEQRQRAASPWHAASFYVNGAPPQATRLDFKPQALPQAPGGRAGEQTRPVLPGAGGPCAQSGTTLSFLDRQIQQTEQKLANMMPHQLCQKDTDGDTLLHIAVVHGQRALACVLARMMAEHGYLDEVEHNGLTALHLATVTDQPLIVGDLLRLGAQSNTADRWGRGLIHVCAEGGLLQVLEVLQKGLKHRGDYLDVDATNFEGLTPLHCAVVAHGQVVRELQAMGCCPQGTLATADGAEHERLRQRKQHLLGTIAMLLGMGASLRTQDGKSGRTVIHFAVQDSNIELLDFLLRLPTCSAELINMKAYNGNTALHVAAGMGSGGGGSGHQESMIMVLMHYGADPSVRNLENELPLNLVSQGSVGADLVKQILRGRAALSQRARAPVQIALGRQ